MASRHEPLGADVILLLTNADTELLAVCSVLHRLPAGFPGVRAANPARLDGVPDLTGVQAVIVRLLGGRRAWEISFDELRQRAAEAGIPLIAVGGEASADPELVSASSVPAGISAEV